MPIVHDDDGESIATYLKRGETVAASNDISPTSETRGLPASLSYAMQEMRFY